MVNIINRYLIKNIIQTFLFILVLLIVIATIHKISGYLNKVINGLLIKDFIFLLILLKSIYFLIILIPISFLISIQLVLGNMYRSHEITAIIVSGYKIISLHKIIFLLAIPLALITGSISIFLLPKIVNIQAEILHKSRILAEVSIIRSGVFQVLTGGKYTIYVDNIKQGALEKIFIYSTEENLSKDSIIITGISGQQFDDSNYSYLIIKDGTLYKGIPGHNDYQVVKFEIAKLRLATKFQPNFLKNTETIPTSELLGSNKPEYIAELYKRLSSPIQVLLIALWVPIIVNINNHYYNNSNIVNQYISLFILMLVYVVNFNLIKFCEALIIQGIFGNAIGLCLHILFVLFSLGLYQYQKRLNLYR